MNDIDEHLGMCETVDIQNNDISKLNSIALGIFENNEENELIPIINAIDESI